MRVRLCSVPILAAVVLAAGAAHAQAPSPKVTVEVGVAREVVRVADDGSPEVVRETVDRARPGDVLVYTVEARNEGDAPALAPRIADPIPNGTVLIVDSVDVAEASPAASVDGGRSWAPFPVVERITGADGIERQVPVPAERYTHLRWELDGALAPGDARSLTFKVRVL